jgi:hypothetical protein
MGQGKGLVVRELKLMECAAHEEYLGVFEVYSVLFKDGEL